MDKTLTVVIKKNGEFSIDANGFVGKECERKSKNITDALGGAITQVKLKPEYDQLEEPALIQTFNS